MLPLLLAAFHVSYATFLGGSLDEQAAGVAVNSAGEAFVAGTTSSPNFPLTSTALGVPASGHPCAFVTKLNASGTGALWSVCLANSTATAMALDPGGNIYLLTNTDTLTKLSAGADRILYSKKIGGSAAALAVDAAGNAYVAGSANSGLTTTVGAYQSTLAPGACPTGFLLSPPVPCSDAFVLKVAPDGGTLFSTYLGGSGADAANAIAIDGQGNVWVAGSTVSPNFPVTAGAWESAFHGEVDLGPLQYGDGFAAKLDATGSRLLYATFLGGSAPDAASTIAIDNAGAAYVGGATQSADFPTTSGALQRTYGGGAATPSLAGDAFVVKFDSSGAVVYATFLGGPQFESASQLAVDAQGNAYLNAYAGTLSVLSPDGSALVESAPLSGRLALDAQGAVYFAGASSGWLFFPSIGALQTKFGGGPSDTTLVKIDFTQPPSPWIATILNAAGMRTGTPQNYPVFDVAPDEIVTIFGSGFDANTRILFDGIPAVILYEQANQINAVVPMGVSGPLTAITLEGGGQSFGPGAMNVLDAVPALFTADGTGKGQASALNEDGTVNSSANPAQRGSIITVFLTGTGRVTSGVGCNLGDVISATSTQVRVRISETVAPGPKIPIVVYIGNYASGFTGDTTIAIH